MNYRILGYVLVSIAILATILAFATSAYIPGRGLAFNLANARVLQMRTSVEVPCPRPSGGYLATPPFGCPQTASAWSSSSTRTTSRVTFNGITLGVAVTLTSALALAGVGLLIFGGKRATR